MRTVFEGETLLRTGIHIPKLGKAVLGYTRGEILFS
jgi:hypothetical protein